MPDDPLAQYLKAIWDVINFKEADQRLQVRPSDRADLYCY